MPLKAGPAGGPLRGRVRPPGDKSISHRALILGGLASGSSDITGLLESADTLATKEAMIQLGATFSQQEQGLRVNGVGDTGICTPAAPLDMGNSGTAMRLLAGVLAAQPFDSVLTGDASLTARPMKRIIKPLAMMGATLSSQEGGRAPLRISGNPNLTGICYASPVASAQVKSCVLLAGLFAGGKTQVTEPRLSRDHTERMLPRFGIQLLEDGGLIGPQSLRGASIQVPADPSSAAFLAVAALLVPGSELCLVGVGMNPTRAGVFEVMAQMGADLDIQYRDEPGLEPVADIQVRYSGRLKAVEVDPALVPSMIDEVPVLLALAALSEGTTRLREAAELRVKESDRLAVMATGLKRLGISVTEYPDGIDVTGGQPGGGSVDAAHDHRCAMSFAVLAQALEAGQSVSIAGAEYIDTSYPGFVGDLVSAGGNLVWETLDG